VNLSLRETQRRGAWRSSSSYS